MSCYVVIIYINNNLAPISRRNFRFLHFEHRAILHSTEKSRKIIAIKCTGLIKHIANDGIFNRAPGNRSQGVSRTRNSRVGGPLVFVIQ